MNTLFESTIKSLPLINRGKVRDLYEIDDKHLLIVTTDRISAFDVVLPTAITGKGIVLTETAKFWMKKFKHILPNQLADDLKLTDFLTPEEIQEIGGRAMIVHKLKPLPIEAIVRGYIVGSGWKEYKKNGTVCGIKLAKGLSKAEKLPEPIFTPSTKADIGDHDENISYQEMVKIIGKDKAKQVKKFSLELYQQAAEFAIERGIIIADTKFEFGEDENGVIHLIDEALTPDSSRFWSAKSYKTGSNPNSFDKQYVRDYLETLAWNKKSPAPELPQKIVDATLEKYQEAQARLMENN